MIYIEKKYSIHPLHIIIQFYLLIGSIYATKEKNIIDNIKNNKAFKIINPCIPWIIYIGSEIYFYRKKKFNYIVPLSNLYVACKNSFEIHKNLTNEKKFIKKIFIAAHPVLLSLADTGCQYASKKYNVSLRYKLLIQILFVCIDKFIDQHWQKNKSLDEVDEN